MPSLRKVRLLKLQLPALGVAAVGLTIASAVLATVSARTLPQVSFPSAARTTIVQRTLTRPATASEIERWGKIPGVELAAAFDSRREPVEIAGVALAQGVASVSASFYTLFKIPMIMGRRPDLGRAEVAVSADLCERQPLDACSSWLGREVGIGAAKYTIVGVLDPSRTVFAGLRYWVPIGPHEQSPLSYLVLRPGLSRQYLAAAIARVSGLTPSQIEVRNFRTESLREIGRPLIPLLASALILAGLSLATAASLETAAVLRRDREFSIRRALGASDGGIFRMLAGEAALLWASCCAVSIPLSYALCKLLARGTLRAAGVSPSIFWLSIGSVALVAAVAQAAVWWAVFARSWLRRARGEPVFCRPPGAGTLSAARGVESALAYSALFAGLLLTSALAKMQRQPTGFDASDVSVLGLRPEPGRVLALENVAAWRQAVLKIASALPSASRVALASDTPLGGEDNFAILATESHPRLPSQVTYCTSSYFSALGIHITSGSAGSGGAGAYLSRTAAQRWLGGQNPIGAGVVLRSENPPPRFTVQGTVDDVGRFSGAPPVLFSPPGEPQVYLPMSADRTPDFYLIVRSHSRAEALAASLGRRIASRGIGLVIASTVNGSDAIAAATAPQRDAWWMMLWVSAASLLLVCGEVVAATQQRARVRRVEFATRLALGAVPQHLAFSQVLKALAPSAIGILLGGLFAPFLLEYFRTLSLDPGRSTVIGCAFVAAVVLLTAASSAAWPPMRTATSRASLAELLREV